MSIVVLPQNKQEELELLAFLDSRHYRYQTDVAAEKEFLMSYNQELSIAEAEIDAGDFLSHEQVKEFFSTRKSQ